MRLIIQRERAQSLSVLPFKKSDVQFKLKARLELTPEEMRAVEDFGLKDYPIRRMGSKEPKEFERAGELIKGKEYKLLTLRAFLATEVELKDGCRRLSNMIGYSSTFEGEEVVEFQPGVSAPEHEEQFGYDQMESDPRRGEAADAGSG